MHYALTTYATYFPPSGVTRNAYAGRIRFDFISSTLVSGWGELNSNRYNGIMFDNAITDNEIQYLIALKDSADTMVAAITEKGDSYQLVDMSPSALDEVICDFTDKYYFVDDDSPLKLLFE